jgi:hypothetical protein
MPSVEVKLPRLLDPSIQLCGTANASSGVAARQTPCVAVVNGTAACFSPVLAERTGQSSHAAATTEATSNKVGWCSLGLRLTAGDGRLTCVVSSRTLGRCRVCRDDAHGKAGLGRASRRAATPGGLPTNWEAFGRRTPRVDMCYIYTRLSPDHISGLEYAVVCCVRSTLVHSF